jgi:hypothetical protein
LNEILKKVLGIGAEAAEEEEAQNRRKRKEKQEKKRKGREGMKYFWLREKQQGSETFLKNKRNAK